MALRYQRLYVNIDHVATVRQARRGQEPDPVAAALLCERAGADGITAHLREDRRHIQDDDIHRLMAQVTTLLNLECATTDDMLSLAETLRPAQVTLVPERREEITTEGGLDVVRHEVVLRDAIARLRAAGIRSSLFIDPEREAVDVSHRIGADAVELHTGQYAHAPRDPATLRALRDAAAHGASIGIAVHAGHGLSVANVGPVAAIPEIEELNIGHAIVGHAIFVGLDAAVREIRTMMDDARAADHF
jgi:pyridoxine 5-phosphate synthase